MKTGKFYPYLLVIGGLIGVVMSFVLTMDKIALLENPAVQLPCNINPVIGCGSVISTWQASAFKVPNPLLGIAGYSMVLLMGLLLLSGSIISKNFFKLFLTGILFAEIFIHWLIYQSVYEIGALCIYCMVTWAVTWPLFLYTWVNLKKENDIEKSFENQKPAKDFLVKNHLVIFITWYLLIFLLILWHFRDFFLD